MKKHTVMYHYVNALSNCLRSKDKDKDIATILKDCNIPENLNADERIDSCNFMLLMQITMVELGDELFALTKAKVPLRSFSYISHAMISNRNLKSALQLGGDFYHQYLNAYQFQIVIDEINQDAELIITLNNPELDTDHLLAEFLLHGWHRFASWMIGKNIGLKRASFNYPTPKHELEYQFLFQCPKRFNQKKLSICFDASYLNESIVKSNADELKDYLQNSLHNLLFIPIEDESFTFKVRELIEKVEQKWFPTFDEISKKLFMTPRTLRVRLKKEGTNYQQIKEMSRRDTAIYHLNNQNLRISQIAYKSGFSEPSTFTRAFKKWTGLSPREYREKEVASLFTD